MEKTNQNILEALDILIQKALDNFSVCGIYVGVVLEVIDSKTYIIKYNEKKKKIRTKNNLGLNIANKVTVLSMTNSSDCRLLEDVKIEVDGVDLSNYVEDKRYVHTDNNYTDEDKSVVRSINTTIKNEVAEYIQTMTENDIDKIYNEVFG